MCERTEFPERDSGIKMLISEYSESFKKTAKSGWGCGYVTIPKNHPAYRVAEIERKRIPDFFYWQPPGFTDEVTLCEFRDDGLFIGFDTAHLWNSKSQDRQWVFEKTLELAHCVERVGHKESIVRMADDIAAQVKNLSAELRALQSEIRML